MRLPYNKNMYQPRTVFASLFQNRFWDKDFNFKYTRREQREHHDIEISQRDEESGPSLSSGDYSRNIPLNGVGQSSEPIVHSLFKQRSTNLPNTRLPEGVRYNDNDGPQGPEEIIPTTLATERQGLLGDGDDGR